MEEEETNARREKNEIFVFLKKKLKRNGKNASSTILVSFFS